MPGRLYLIETRARWDYVCAGCANRIRRGSRHFRHDPFPAGNVYRNEPTTHWCSDCIASSPGAIRDQMGRIRLPIVNVGAGILPPRSDDLRDLPLFRPLRVELVEIGKLLLPKLCEDPSQVHQLTPDQFEELICERLFAMGLEPKRTGNINSKDGGVDIVFWPRQPTAFPFLGAAQVKHHRGQSTREGSATVREFAGAISAHPFNAGLLITNSSFTPDAQWFARERTKLIRLRDMNDIRRWLFNNFTADSEWREIPRSIELCPGTVISIRD